MINPRDDCPHAYQLSPDFPDFPEQIPSQEIPVENQSTWHTMPGVAARFAGNEAAIGKDRRGQVRNAPAAEGLGSSSSFAGRTS
jgi:hypothetical protein